MRAHSHTGGFTLVELLVAVVVTVIITAQVLLMLTTQQQASVSQERVLDVQQDARLVTELMLGDVRMGGFMVPRMAGLSSRDGGAAGSDVLCASDPSVISEARLAAASAFFDRASLLATLGAGATTVQLLPSELDIDGDGTNDFGAGQGIILSDGTNTHCARIVSVVGNAVQFDSPTPAGFAISPPDARAVPARIFQVTAAGLTRNGLLLSQQVEDLQVEFGVDANGDERIGAGEFPIHDLSGFDPSRIRSVRLSVTTRTPGEDPNFQGVGLAAVANRAAGPADDFRRRRFASVVLPRNLR